MMTDGIRESSAPPPPGQHENPDQPIFSSVFWAELAAVAIVVGAVLFAARPVLAWLQSAVHTPAPATAANGCTPPTEHEVLFIGVAQRPDGQLVITGCTHAAGKGAYYRRGAQ